MIAKSLSMSCGCTDTENQGNKKEKVNRGSTLKFSSLLLVIFLLFPKGEFAFKSTLYTFFPEELEEDVTCIMPIMIV